MAAARLAERFAGTNVVVRTGDATRLPDADESFDSVGTFTMLHHIPTAALQDRLLAEAFRVLRPGGVLVCSDSLASNDLHHFHEGDTYNPVEPSSLLGRLQAIGFGPVTIRVDGVLTFTARKPRPEAEACGAEACGAEAGGAESPAGLYRRAERPQPRLARSVVTRPAATANAASTAEAASVRPASPRNAASSALTAQ